MTFVAVLLLPLLVQALAYVGVFMAAQGGGSFMGLLAMPVAAVSVLAVLGNGIVAMRSRQAWVGPALTGLAIAVLPPIGLLIFRAIES